MLFITTVSHKSRVRVVAMTLFYLAILVGLVVLYTQRHVVPPPFIYQGF
jgi:hypothetical protein